METEVSLGYRDPSTKGIAFGRWTGNAGGLPVRDYRR